MTVTLFNKSFASATDALVATIENFNIEDAIEFEEEGDFIGLSSALKSYSKGHVGNAFIFAWLAEIMLGKEIDELTDGTIYDTALELADYSNFDSVHHCLEIG